MDGKAGEKSGFFQIPIKEYEKDLETEPAKEKKKEILDLFAYSNNLRSEEEFEEIKQELHHACRKGDVELIKIYLCETIEPDSKKILFKIDRTNQTASLFKIKKSSLFYIQEFVPRTVRYESTDYLITSISGTCISLGIIEFAEDSAVRKIYRNAFPYLSRIEEINLPASLEELEEGWCDDTQKLRRIYVSPLNDRFLYKEGKYLFGKSDKNNSEFDVLLFARRDIKEISIPSNIRIISSGAFSGCLELKKVEIPQNSSLQTIGNNAFNTSGIKDISIPSQVSKICKKAFYNCNHLKKVEIPQNSNLKTIGENAFAYSKIEGIYLPDSLKELEEGWCCDTKKLTRINVSPLNDQFLYKEDKYLLGKSDKNSDEFDILLFARYDIEEISIPSNIKIIDSYAIAHCKKLTKIDIPQNSSLQKIGKYALWSSSIKELYLPASLKELEEGWCYEAQYLARINVSPLNDQFLYKEDKYLLGKSDKNSDEFDILLFARYDIEEISIPSNIKIIDSYAFSHCNELTKIDIPQNSSLQTINKSTFSNLEIKKIFIPSNVSKIGSAAFSICRKLTKIEIPQNSNLQTIETHVFSYSNIKEIYIPSKVSKICNDAFNSCKNLTKVEIPQNSNLQKIEDSAFFNSGIKDLFIPSKVSKIFDYAFANCENLRIIEISEDSKLKSDLPKIIEIFKKCSRSIIMIPSKIIAKKLH